MKRVVIVQSNYIPWKGYFDLIGAADVFVIYDEVQYTIRDWRNRNLVKSPQGLKWLTIPVNVSGRYNQSIEDVIIADGSWCQRHWRSLSHWYAKSPGFGLYGPGLEELYRQMAGESRLSVVNAAFITHICGLLGITTKVVRSSDVLRSGGLDRSGRLVELCTALGADVYLSGPAAQNYLQEGLFVEAGVAVEYMDYSGYPEYGQPHGEFVHGVSVLDLLFSEGVGAPAFMKFPSRKGVPARPLAR